MKKHILFTFYFLLFTYISTAQLLYLQQNYKGGVSVDGKSYYFETYLSADTITFQNSVPLGSTLKKALLISMRGNTFPIGATPIEVPLNLMFNGNSVVLDSSAIVSNKYYCNAVSTTSNPSEKVFMVVKDVTSYAINTNNTLIVPCQGCGIKSGQDVYVGFLLVLLYENSSLPATNVAILLNNTSYQNPMNYSFSGLNPINNTNDVGLSIWVEDVDCTIPVGFTLNTFTLGSIYTPCSNNDNNKVPGSFYYQNNTLVGLVDDSNTPQLDSTDAIANIKTYLPNNATSFSLTATLKPDVGCEDLINAFILAYTTPCPVSSLKDTTYRYTICSGKNVQLSVSSNTVNTSYTWYASDSSVNALTTPSVVVSPTVTTNYIAYIDSAGCKQTQHFSVGVIHTPTFDSLLTTNAICGGALGSLTITPTYGYGPPAFHFGVNGSSQTSTVFSNLAPGTYSASVLQGGGVCPYIQTFTITQTNPVTASFTINPDTLCESKEIYFTNTSSGANLNVWYINGDSANTQNTSYVFTDTGFYQITLLAYNNLRQCSDTLTKTILVKYCPPDSIHISVPNIFSPNGDGTNDTWQLIIYNHNYTISNYQCTIYDRWGLKLFSSTTANEAWSGRTTSGEECPADAYFYIIKLTATNSKGTAEQKEFKGFLQLVR